ncbi:MAG: SAVED domain-containing protein [Methylophilaceae bacterium]|nr:SAVED domain-containing protein [Methylophilaceae bacterium]
MTKERCTVGDYAHIIADSPSGARGVPGDSERLAKDPDNLMLLCRECHNRIDRHGQNNQYTPETLRSMKREHEERIQLIYSANGVKESLTILMSFPIGPHPPIITAEEIHYAMLENSGYTRFPTSKDVNIDRSNFDVLDDAHEFWSLAGDILTKLYEQRILPEITARNGVTHLTVAAFAPIPILMKLGALLGNKLEATILDMPDERWLWDKHPDCPAPEFVYDVPDSLPREVAAVVSISNIACHPNMPMVEFKAINPNRAIIRTESHVQAFKKTFNDFLTNLVRSGVQVLHIHPATPLCASVEIGRLLLLKTFEEIHVWEWQAPNWKSAIRLK